MNYSSFIFSILKSVILINVMLKAYCDRRLITRYFNIDIFMDKIYPFINTF